MTRPLVSIIIPAHNGEKYLAAAIQSVLDQHYPNYELLLIDNASQDATRDIAKKFPQVNYIYSEIADTAKARQLGVSLAQGEYISFLDQDDIWAENKLIKQVQFLETQPDYGAVISLQKMYLQTGCLKPHWLKQEFLEKPQPAYLPSALMARREVFKHTGNFNTNFPLTSDVAWFFKAKHLGILIGMLEEVLVYRRIHGDNTSNQHLALQSEILAIIKTSLKERRTCNDKKN